MARKSNTRAASGCGSLRQRSDGRWEARFTYTDDLGQRKRGSVYADTQKECRLKLTATLKAVDAGTYRQTKRYTVSQWLDEWLSVYCQDLKPLSISGYKSKINARIKPYIGNSQLSELTNLQIKKFYNKLQAGDKDHKPLSSKSVQVIHGILHKSLEQAVASGIIGTNPADHVPLPKVKRPDIQPIMDDDVKRFLEAIKGDEFELFFIVALFSGMRQSELVAVQWDDLDMQEGTIAVHRQIQKAHDAPGYHYLDETKNGKERTASVAPSIVRILQEQKRRQAEWQLAAGSLWHNDRNLIFTDRVGDHIKHRTVNNHFKKIVTSIGLPDVRFHDLRHSYAVNAIQAGNPIKVVQEQLGHYSSAFTMDIYAAVSDTMRKQSQDRMEQLFKDVSDL